MQTVNGWAYSIRTSQRSQRPWPWRNMRACRHTWPHGAGQTLTWTYLHSNPTHLRNSPWLTHTQTIVQKFAEIHEIWDWNKFLEIIYEKIVTKNYATQKQSIFQACLFQKIYIVWSFLTVIKTKKCGFMSLHFTLLENYC